MLTFLRGRVKTLSHDCDRCPGFLWKDKLPIRTLSEQERVEFKCPSWCKGHFVNAVDSDDYFLASEETIRQYHERQGNPGKKVARGILFGMLDYATKVAASPKQLRLFFQQPDFASVRHPYG